MTSFSWWEAKSRKLIIVLKVVESKTSFPRIIVINFFHSLFSVAFAWLCSFYNVIACFVACWILLRLDWSKSIVRQFFVEQKFNECICSRVFYFCKLTFSVMCHWLSRTGENSYFEVQYLYPSFFDPISSDLNYIFGLPVPSLDLIHRPISPKNLRRFMIFN